MSERRTTQYHEEKKAGIVPIARGKVVWIDEKTKLPFDTSLLFKSHSAENKILSETKNKLKDYLSHNGFVFFEETVYRYKLNRIGRVTDFGINYRHIN